MVEKEEEDLDCKSILIVGGIMLAGFFVLSFYNTSRLHDLIQELLNRPERERIVYSHDGETGSKDETGAPDNRIVKTQNGRRICNA